MLAALLEVTMVRVVLALCLLSLPALAQPSPYAGQQHRAIKALSEPEVADLLAGRGMGLAKAAELNSYPGPLHALEMAQALGLDAGQLAQLQAAKRRMSEDAQALGRQLVDAERRLDALFASKTIDAAALKTVTAEIGRLHGALRYVHLAAHLETRAAMTEAQVRRYDELRGYSGSGDAPAHHRHKH